MNKITSLMSAVLLLLSISVSCATIKGNGDLVKENRNAANFENVVLSGSIDVIISYDEQHSVVVECESNFLEFIVTDVQNGTLKIHVKDNTSLRPSKKDGKILPIVVHVALPVAESITLNGSGDIYVWNNVKFNDNASISLIGSGDIECKDINTKNCNLILTGSGDLEVDNIHSENAVIKLKGSGDLEVSYIDSKNIMIDLNGSGDIEANGKCKDMKLSLYGSGDLDTKIDYENCEINLSGSGDISLKKSGKTNINSKSGSGDINIR